MPRTILSHTGFQPLKEVWIGDTYPANFYDHYDNKSKDIFQQITEITKKDIDRLESAIRSFGVHTCRPKFNKIDDYLDDKDNLIKPPISPRDWAMTLGDTLYITPQYYSGIEPWQEDINAYIHNGQNVKILDRSSDTAWAWANYPSVVRVGRDIFVDYGHLTDDQIPYIHNVADELANNYRVHLSRTGDHSDGIFCPVKQGYIMSTHYRTNYTSDFPGWKMFELPDSSTGFNGMNGNWWLPGIDYAHYNSAVISKAEHWLGCPQETIFEVNMLVIDEKNVLVIARNDTVCEYLESIGITPHVIDFQTRSFWDSGLHCLTVDICRQGPIIDYWPNRGDPGIYTS